MRNYLDYLAMVVLDFLGPFLAVPPVVVFRLGRGRGFFILLLAAFTLRAIDEARQLIFII